MSYKTESPEESAIDKARRLLANEEIVVDSGSWRKLVGDLLKKVDDAVAFADRALPFARLGAWAIKEGHVVEIGDIDGGSLQDAATERRVLEMVTVHDGPCAEHCRCALDCGGKFPVECYRIKDLEFYTALVVVPLDV